MVYNNIVCITVNELTEGAVMSYDNYKKLVQRNRLHIMRQGKGLGNCALVEWSSIPLRFKEKYIKTYGDPELTASRRQLAYDQKAIEFYTEYRHADGSRLKSGVQEEYVLNASVLNSLLEGVRMQRQTRNMYGNSTPISWDGVQAECERFRNEYGHTLPRSLSRLRRKMNEYVKDGYAALISGKLTNTNAAKITEESIELLIALKRCRVPVYTTVQIYDEYNRIAAERGWKLLTSVKSVTQLLQRPEVRRRWLAATAGELAAKKEYMRQHVTMMPSCRDALWYGDGTKLNLFYKEYTPSGYRAATVQVFEVIDAYSECLLGYNISRTENFSSMYEAYRMAIENTGRIPVELVYDNQGGTRRTDAKEFLSRIARCSRPSAPHNAASKSIESVFCRFQQQVLHKFWNYTGGNITARSEASRPNIEFIEANIAQLPTFEELCSQYAQARQEWNNMPHFKYNKSRVELYAASSNPESVKLTDNLRENLFWLTSSRECRFTARGIQFTIDKQTYNYEVYTSDGMPDMAFRRDNTGRSFVVQYDPHDMGRIRLCTRDNYGYQFVAYAETYRAVHRALQDQTQAERSFLRQIDELNRSERVRMQIDGLALDMKYGIAPEQHGLVTPAVQGVTRGTYERVADRLHADSIENKEASVLPSTVGSYNKEVSNITFDKVSAYDRM